MNLSINPLTFQTMRVQTADQQKTFLYQLSTLLMQMANQENVLSTFNGLSAILNGSNSLNYNALNISASNLGTVSTNQTINCASAAIVVVSFTFSASITLTLNNLGTGVPVQVVASSTGAFTLKMAATLPSGASYTAISFLNGGAITSLISTGWVSAGAATRTFIGTTNLSGILQMAFV